MKGMVMNIAQGHGRIVFPGTIGFAALLAVGGINILYAASDITGVVTSTLTGKGLAGALITRLTDTAQAVTDATGRFSLPPWQSATNRTAPVSLHPGLRVVGKSIHFTVEKTQRVAIDRFSPSGRRIQQPLSRIFEPGNYSFLMPSATDKSAGVCVDRVKLGKKEYVLFTVAAGPGIGGLRPGSMVDVPNSGSYNVSGTNFAKKATTAETLAVSRTGYKKVKVSYENNLLPLIQLDTAGLFIFVEGGTFTQGTDDTAFYTSPNYRNRGPAHSVTVSDFYYGKYNTTFDDYDAFALATGRPKPLDQPQLHGGGYRSGHWGRGTLPVLNVTWYEAITFANWLSELDGLTPAYAVDTTVMDTNNIDTTDKKKWSVSADWNVNGYRLATEAEWEYAAQGGKSGHRFLFSGSDTLSAIAWCGWNTRAIDTASFGNWMGPQPVGLRPPNELGIYDLCGNAPTLLWDPILNSQVSGGNTDYTAAAINDPKGTQNKYDRRAVRGGGYHSGNVCNFTVARHFKNPTARCAFGFRLARSK